MQVLKYQLKMVKKKKLIVDCEGVEESPDPLHGSVGMSAVWATMEEATLSPRAHMALLDGPEKGQLDGKEKCPGNDLNLQCVFYLETIFQLYPAVQGV